MTLDIESVLGQEAEALLSYQGAGFARGDLQLPGPDYMIL